MIRRFTLVNDIAEQARSGWNRPPVIEPDGEGELLEVSMGPQHPSTHGVFRMDVALDGERVQAQAGLRLPAPQPRKNRRNHDAISASMPYTDRLDYFCSLTNNWAYALAVEKLAARKSPSAREYSASFSPN